jgi:endonuclease/exonuclease/phosphatase family metal-dependent hydrolase
MKRVLWTVIGVLIGLHSAYAQDFSPGDLIRLMERDNHIPAHPAPGDTHVHVRFTSGAAATVLNVDAQTGWIEIQSEPLSGTQTTGWIVKRYIMGRLDGGSLPTDPLAWCPSKGLPQPHPSGRLRLASWNLGNLHAENGQSIFGGHDPSVKRSTDDYDRIRCYVRLFDPDILAVQEVDGEEALSRVVDAEVYHVNVSSRPQGNLNGKQNTGFAYKRGLRAVEPPDFEALNTSGRVRRGTRLDVTHNGQTLQLMSVHLKSGCFQNGSTSSACHTLAQQISVLETWIDQAAQGADPFIVLGDFNRRLNLDGDDVWTELDDGQPANADLASLTKDMPISCRDNQFTTFIDHIVVDKRVVPWVDRTSFRHMTYRQADKAVWDQISDHCPVIVDLWIE